MLPNIVQISIFWLVQASALLVFTVPFRWPLVGLWAVSHFLRAVGLTLLFHRYLAHRAFKMNRVARFVWAFIGTAAMQKGPLWWAGHHVNHHKYADRDGDPHSPMVSGFYYAHIGWFLNDTKHDQLEPSNPVIRDFGKAPELALLERFFIVPPIVLAAAMYLIGGWAWLVYGFCLPTMTLAHATFCINTVNHMFGSRRFETVDESRNNAVHRVLRGRRGLAQQPSPLSARRAQRLLLVGVRPDLVHHPRDVAGRPGRGTSRRCRSGSTTRRARGKSAAPAAPSRASSTPRRCSSSPKSLSKKKPRRSQRTRRRNQI